MPAEVPPSEVDPVWLTHVLRTSGLLYQGSVRSYWEPKMRCLIEAFEDWNCLELLQP